MELFSNTHYDFLGMKWRFILPSLILLLAGLISLAAKNGPQYSIDFKGGAVMDVAWKDAPPVGRIRTAVSSRLRAVSVVGAHDLTGSNEVLISVPAEGDLTSLRQILTESLSSVDTRYSIRSFEVIGPQIGADMRSQALHRLPAGAFGGNASLSGVALSPGVRFCRRTGNGT